MELIDGVLEFPLEDNPGETAGVVWRSKWEARGKVVGGAAGAVAGAATAGFAVAGALGSLEEAAGMIGDVADYLDTFAGLGSAAADAVGFLGPLGTVLKIGGAIASAAGERQAAQLDIEIAKKQDRDRKKAAKLEERRQHEARMKHEGRRLDLSSVLLAPEGAERALSGGFSRDQDVGESLTDPAKLYALVRDADIFSEPPGYSTTATLKSQSEPEPEPAGEPECEAESKLEPSKSGGGPLGEMFTAVSISTVQRGKHPQAPKSRTIKAGEQVMVLEQAQHEGRLLGRISATEWVTIETAAGKTLLTQGASKMAKSSKGEIQLKMEVGQVVYVLDERRSSVRGGRTAVYGRVYHPEIAARGVSAWVHMGALEQCSSEAQLFSAKRSLVVRNGVSTTTAKSRVLEGGQIVVVHERAVSDGAQRGRISATEWVTIVTAESHVLAVQLCNPHSKWTKVTCALEPCHSVTQVPTLTAGRQLKKGAFFQITGLSTRTKKVEDTVYRVTIAKRDGIARPSSEVVAQSIPEYMDYLMSEVLSAEERRFYQSAYYRNVDTNVLSVQPPHKGVFQEQEIPAKEFELWHSIAEEMDTGLLLLNSQSTWVKYLCTSAERACFYNVQTKAFSLQPPVEGFKYLVREQRGSQEFEHSCTTAEKMDAGLLNPQASWGKNSSGERTYYHNLNTEVYTLQPPPLAEGLREEREMAAQEFDHSFKKAEMNDAGLLNLQSSWLKFTNDSGPASTVRSTYFYNVDTAVYTLVPPPEGFREERQVFEHNFMTKEAFNKLLKTSKKMDAGELNLQSTWVKYIQGNHTYYSNGEASSLQQPREGYREERKISGVPEFRYGWVTAEKMDVGLLTPTSMWVQFDHIHPNLKQKWGMTDLAQVGPDPNKHFDLGHNRPYNRFQLTLTLEPVNIKGEGTSSRFTKLTMKWSHPGETKERSTTIDVRDLTASELKKPRKGRPHAFSVRYTTHLNAKQKATAARHATPNHTKLIIDAGTKAAKAEWMAVLGGVLPGYKYRCMQSGREMHVLEERENDDGIRFVRITSAVAKKARRKKERRRMGLCR
eukprot:COSAG01_NODE_4583_length_4900_cov_9.820662_2_plen_1058_part_00